MDKLIGILLCIFGLAGFLLSAAMTVMAIRFMEYGRVLFYGMLAIFSIESFIFGFLRLKKKS